MAISADMVKELREATGAAVLDCKKALEQFEGDMDKAKAFLAEKGLATAAKKGIPVPAFSTALAFYDQYRAAVLPANLLQAQRDYFGAHTYERVDKPRGEFFHTNWTGRGGTTSSSTYNV